MAKKSLVALVKGTDIQENVTRVFDLMGGVEHVIRKNSTVVLKPNAGHAEPPETSVCTNPEVVRAVVREVKKANPKKNHHCRGCSHRLRYRRMLPRQRDCRSGGRRRR